MEYKLLVVLNYTCWHARSTYTNNNNKIHTNTHNANSLSKKKPCVSSYFNIRGMRIAQHAYK